MRPLLPSVLLALSLAACSAPADTGVTVYRGTSQIGGDYEVVAFLQPPPSTGYGGPDDVTRELRTRAAELGADGLLILTREDELSEAQAQAAITRGTSLTRTRYVAIRVGPPTAPPK